MTIILVDLFLQVTIGVVRNLNIRKTALKPRKHLKKQNKWQVFTHTQK
jgi:hypothetical protein